MNTLIPTLGALAGQNVFLAYLIIYVSTIFLGNISAFTSFWIISQGYLGNGGVPLLLLMMFLANITGDLMWYGLGRRLRNTPFGNWLKNHIRGHEKLERVLVRNGRKLQYFSKFLYGASFPAIFLMGWMRMDFGKFFRTSILAVLLWIPIFLGLSYALLSGLSPLLAIAAFKQFEVVFLIGLALFLVVDYLISKLIVFFFEKESEPAAGAEQVPFDPS